MATGMTGLLWGFMAVGVAIVGAYLWIKPRNR
jgi:hypothetical protein